MLHQQVLNLQFQPSKRCNLTPVVSSALMDLQKRDNIVVKPANNVGAIVVWDRNPHIKEAYKHPDNPMNFQKCLIKKKKTFLTFCLHQLLLVCLLLCFLLLLLLSIHLLAPDEDNFLLKALVFHCFLVFCCIGEYISLDLFHYIRNF